MKKYVVRFNKGQASYRTKDPKKAQELCQEVRGKMYAIDNKTRQ